MNGKSNSEARSMGRWLVILLWVVQILLAAYFLAVQGVPKLLGSADAVRLFDDIGMGQWLRYVTGVLEVAGAIGLLIPRINGLAAAGLAGVMVGATISNLTTPGYAGFAWQTIGLFVIFVLLAVARWSEIRSLPALLSRRGAAADS